MADRMLDRVAFVFNETDNGGESLMLVTEILADDETSSEVHLSQTLTLQSYCNSASFHLCGATMTPALLRDLADKLEDAIMLVKEKKG